MAMTFGPATRARSRGPVRYFAVAGEGGGARLDRLALEPGMEPAASPRWASLLLVSGTVPERAFAALGRLHDQLPHPRAAVCWEALPGPLAGAVTVSGHGAEGVASAARELAALQAELFSGDCASSPALLADEPPAPWRGLGDHGQGGEGMMGGKPYGRPMAMPDQDLRDGLMLDAYPVTVGPFAPMLPSGLELELILQGDVIAQARIAHPPFPDPESQAVFRTAPEQPISIPAMERARGAHHLRAAARLVRLRGLAPLARRLMTGAATLERGGTVNFAALRRWLRWSGLLAGLERGLGRLTDQDARSASGPARRAAGKAEDHRTALDAYTRAGFRPRTQPGGDVRARLMQWLAEAEQAQALARTAPGVPVTWPNGVEGPAGPHRPGRAAAPPLGADGVNRLLTGLDWGQAVTVLASFDVTSLNRMLAPEGP